METTLNSGPKETPKFKIKVDCFEMAAKPGAWRYTGLRLGVFNMMLMDSKISEKKFLSAQRYSDSYSWLGSIYFAADSGKSFSARMYLACSDIIRIVCPFPRRRNGISTFQIVKEDCVPRLGSILFEVDDSKAFELLHTPKCSCCCLLS